jgi:heme A synthase
MKALTPNMFPPQQTPRWLRRFTKLVAACTLFLIFAGAMVTSTGSGLAVPDWPNTYGWFMFTFPLSKMVGGIFYEHGHRLIASPADRFSRRLPDDHPGCLAAAP